MSGRTNAKKGRYIVANELKYVGNPHKVVYRSSWEYYFMRWLDTNDNVTHWNSEELKIPYFMNKVRHTYYPDFLVRFKSGESYLVEVKPYAETMPPKPPDDLANNTATNSYKAKLTTYVKNQLKWEAARSWCETRGIQFIVLTEKELFARFSVSKAKRNS